MTSPTFCDSNHRQNTGPPVKVVQRFPTTTQDLSLHWGTIPHGEDNAIVMSQNNKTMLHNTKNMTQALRS